MSAEALFAWFKSSPTPVPIITDNYFDAPGVNVLLQAVRGMTYSTGQTFELYPTSGTATDYPYSRHWVDATKTKTLGFLIEWGTEFQPPWAEMENIILDVSAALLEFAIAAPCLCYRIVR